MAQLEQLDPLLAERIKKQLSDWLEFLYLNGSFTPERTFHSRESALGPVRRDEPPPITLAGLLIQKAEAQDGYRP